MSNRLARETSPYLRQHADNPVEWYPWGDEAFAQARRLDRPMLLSVGYSACHWCHVMAHESFENPEIAALMNELFVSVKVDREERPDVDRIYMQAVQALTQNGGWPMTVFLTPEGVPYFGGTYFPPEDRQGMRGFPFVLRAAADTYRTRRADVEAAGARLREAITTPRLKGDGQISDQQVEHGAGVLVAQADMRAGGWGGGPKFPHAAAVDLLLRRYSRSHDQNQWEVAFVALDQMARGGIFDQVGGGFHRYSVDGEWRVPHFEKMLYDNGLLVPVYLHAYQLTGEDRWKRVVEQTLDYGCREMRLEGGGFASSQDADSQSETGVSQEGIFFVWTPAELRAVLGEEDGAAAARLFGVDERGNFEGGATVLSLPTPGSESDLSTERVDDIRHRLFAARSRRAAPARDDKVLTSWNALMIAALAESGAVLDRSDYVSAARAGADFLLDNLFVNGVLQRTWRDGVAKIAGFLEDSAYLADALLTVYEATGEPRYFERARELGEDIMARFHVPGEGFYDTAADGDDLIVRPFTFDDNPIPAGQSVAARAFLRLGAFTGDGAWRDRALGIITPLAAAVSRAPLALPNLAAALDWALASPREVAIAGDPAAPDTRALVRVAHSSYDPARVLAWGAPDGVPLLAERPTVGGAATAYVCENFSCRAPITDPERLRDQLRPA